MVATAGPREVAMVLETLAYMPYWDSAIRQLTADGWAVTLISVRGPGPLADALSDTPWRVHTLGARSAKDYPRAAWRLARVLRKTAPRGVVHACEDIATVVSAAATRAAPGWRVLSHRHYVASPSPMLLRVLARRWPAHTMAVSQAAGESARSEGIPAERLHVALNGVPEPTTVSRAQRAQLRTDIGARDWDVVIAIIARLRVEKGHQILAEAVALLPPSLQDRLVVLVVGDGPDRERVQELADASPARWCVTGQLQDVGPMMAASDIIVVPSTAESFGLAAAEAMAARRPLVASRVGGLSEVVGGEKFGWLVDPGSAPGLAEGLRQAIEDRGEAARRADLARQRYEHLFTVPAMTKAWREVYAAVLADAGPQPVTCE